MGVAHSAEQLACLKNSPDNCLVYLGREAQWALSTQILPT